MSSTDHQIILYSYMYEFHQIFIYLHGCLHLVIPYTQQASYVSCILNTTQISKDALASQLGEGIGIWATALGSNSHLLLTDSPRP